jgi:hypothetical protein
MPIIFGSAVKIGKEQRQKRFCLVKDVFHFEIEFF